MGRNRNFDFPRGNCRRGKLRAPEKKVIAIVFNGGYVVSDVKLSYEHIEYAWISLEDILGMESLPAYFRDFFEQFAHENKQPSEFPI